MLLRRAERKHERRSYKEPCKTGVDAVLQAAGHRTGGTVAALIGQTTHSK